MEAKGKDCGVVFVASGAFHAAAAIEAAKSVRHSNPWLKVDLFTDADVPTGLFDRVTYFGNGHMRAKVDWLAASRFERTLYLDADTRVVADLAPMFALLDRFDIALAHAHQRAGGRQNLLWKKPVPSGFPQFNGGVILYRRCPSVQAFMADWGQAYHEAGFKWDQITLRELLWLSDLRLYVLPPEYNVRYRKYLNTWEPEEAQAKILHFAEFYELASSASGMTKPKPSFIYRLTQHFFRLTLGRRNNA